VKGTLLDKAKLKGAKKAPKTATEQQQQQEKQQQKQDKQTKQQQQQQQQQQQRPGQGGMTQRDWQLFGTAVLSKAAFIAGNVLMSALQ
jgi:Flp pilus assembly protein TadB